MEHVAKGIIYKLVYGTSRIMTEHLFSRLHSQECAAELIVQRHEDDDSKRRSTLEDNLREYEEAKNVIEVIEGIINSSGEI